MRFSIRDLLKPLAIVSGLTVAGCGTTYQLPEISEGHTGQAANMFAKAQSQTSRRQLSVAAAERRFRRVAARVGPVGKSFCEQLTAERPDFECNVQIAIRRDLPERNAFFTYVDGKPSVFLTLPLLQDSASDDEVAFVMAHEYGHLIGRHIEKQQQQMVAGALIMGAIGAGIAANSAQSTGYYNSSIVSDSVDLGMAAGSIAYSQSYELESDTLGARIAHEAGYDPVKGAGFFARPEDARTGAGKLSFWGTHPPDEKRFATVLATVEEIEADVGLKEIN